eukprot:3818553-Lingulodinium_polyedra.AAC.1
MASVYLPKAKNSKGVLRKRHSDHAMARVSAKRAEGISDGAGPQHVAGGRRIPAELVCEGHGLGCSDLP